MNRTSFGEMEIILKQDGKPQVEYLKFHSEGRTHKHLEFESFFVLKGKGQVFVGEKVIDVQEGSLIVIPPQTSHWMKPSSGNILEGLLWYHQTPISFHSQLFT